MANDNNFLYDKFNIYYENAISAKENGNFQTAKRNLLLAAECLYMMAKNDEGELKTSRIERADKLVEIAKKFDTIPNKKGTDNDNTLLNKNKVKNDNEENDWQQSDIPNIHFDDVAGLEEVKKTIFTRMINPIKYPEKYKLYNKKTGGGVLLYGPPGTGKTMIAKAIACEVGAKFYAIKCSDIVSKWVGESEKNINSLFETARKDKLAIIFVDEMDSLFAQRGQDPHNDKRVNEFLQQIDGFMGRNQNLLLLGATNRPWDIDGAAVRSGRFSEKIYVPLPDFEARKYMVGKLLKSVPLEDDVDINSLSEMLEGYSGADIEEVCDRAKEGPLLKYIETDEVQKITKNDFLDAVSKVRPMVSEEEIEKFEKYAGIRK